MRGFAARADVEEVERFLAACVSALPAEDVALEACAGRVLAEDVRSEVDVPAFARSAMDGFAVRGADTFGASDYDPIALRVVGQALPGRPFAGAVGPGEAVRIMTGAPLPEGADAVAPAETCAESDGRVGVREAVPPLRHVGARGEDVRAGETVLRAGRRLRPQDAGLLASLGAPAARCHRRPRVALLMTGDELLPPGSRPDGAHIVDSNSLVLRGLAARDGAVVTACTYLPDRAERIRAALLDADADALLVSGGSSVGQEDHAPRLVAELGTLDFHGIAMRPSSPAGVGRIGERKGAQRPRSEAPRDLASREPSGGQRLVFLLPGNPVSCLCAYEFFAGPTLRALGGRPRAWPHRRVRLPLARKIASAIGRVDYVRVAIEGGRVVPLATSGASILSSTVRAAGAVIVPRGLEGVPEGAEVEVLLYDDAPADAP
jgi:molybdopterin molybdotransferase